MKASRKQTDEEKHTVLLRWMNPFDIEKELGFTKANQAQMRMKKKIPFCKVGGYILYDRLKIDKWIEDHEVDIAS